MVGSWKEYGDAHPNESTEIVVAYHVDGKHYIFTKWNIYLIFNDKITPVQIRWEN